MTDDTNATEIIENRYIEQFKNSKIVKFFSENASTKIALLTAIITVGSFMIRILWYFYLKGFLSVFSIAADSMDYSSNQWFLEFLTNAVVFIGFAIAIAFFCMVLYHPINLRNARKARYTSEKYRWSRKVKFFLSDTFNALIVFVSILLLVQIINIILSIFLVSTNYIFSLSYLLAASIAFSVIEIIIALVMVFVVNPKRQKRQAETISPQTLKTKSEAYMVGDGNAKESIARKNLLCLLEFVLIPAISCFLMFGAFYYAGVSKAKQMKAFYVIEDKYAIIYQNNEYYWTVAIKDNEDSNGGLTLDTTVQKVIGKEGVEITFKNFAKINIEKN